MLFGNINGWKSRRLTTRRAVDIVDLLGYESDAFVWYRLVRHFGSAVLAAYDVGQ